MVEPLLLAAHSEPQVHRAFPLAPPGITPDRLRGLPRLVAAFSPSVTSLAGHMPAHPRRTPGQPSPAQFPPSSEGRLAISAGRTQKLRPTHRLWAFRNSAPSPNGPYWQALLTFAPFVVELFPAAFSRAVPGPVGFGPAISLCRETESPRQLRCLSLSALTPQTGFSPALCRHSLFRKRGLSLSPPFGERHRIERPVCLRAMCAAFTRASLRRTGQAPLGASGSTGEKTRDPNGR